MKNLLITLCFVLGFCSYSYSQATDYTMFEWDVIRLGVSNPFGHDNLTGGPSIGGELRFNLTNEISLGLGSEYVFFNANNLEGLENDENATVDLSSYSYLAGDYYFIHDSSNRPFVGIGIGYTDIGKINIEIDGANDDVTYAIGESGAILLPRVGYELGHVRFLVNYHIGLNKGLPDFICLKVALTLWGGYKG